LAEGGEDPLPIPRKKIPPVIQKEGLPKKKKKVAKPLGKPPTKEKGGKEKSLLPKPQKRWFLPTKSCQKGKLERKKGGIKKKSFHPIVHVVEGRLQKKSKGGAKP